MKILPLVLLGILVAVAVTSQVSAESQAYVAYGECGGRLTAAVEKVVANEDTIFIGQDNGYVRAVSRENGRELWHWPSTFTPDAGVKDLVLDGNSLYVVVSEINNGAVDPLVSLNAATGSVQWLNPSVENRDVFRIVVDENYIYAGLDAGIIVKVDKASGQVVKSGGQPLRFVPGFADGTTSPNGIYAMQLVGDSLYAARNHGDESGIPPVNLTHANNTILILDKTTLTPLSGTGEFQMYAAERQPSVFGFTTDGANIFATGSIRTTFDNNFGGTIGYIARIPLATDSVQPDLMKHFGHADEGGSEIMYTARAPPADPVWSYSGTSIDYGNGQLYVGLKRPTVGPSGTYAIVDPATLDKVGGDNLFTVHGDVTDLYLDLAENRLIAGHACQLGGAKDRSLVIDLELGVQKPVPIVFDPTQYKATNGQISLGLFSFHPAPSAADQNGMEVRVYVSTNDGACADGRSCYSRVTTPEPLSIGANVFQNLPAIQVPVPDGNSIRLLVEIVDSLGRVGQDWTELPFMIDRAPPANLKLCVRPSDADNCLTGNFLTTDPTPTIRMQYSDPLSGVSTNGLRCNINGLTTFGNEVRADLGGLVMDLGSGGNSRLSEGFNNLNCSVTDRAGNTATISEQITLDTFVRSAKLSPPGPWVQDPKGDLSAFYGERVTPIESTLQLGGGEIRDVMDDLILTETVSGTQVILRPPVELPTGFAATWKLTVVDDAGNVGTLLEAEFQADPDAPRFAQVVPAESSLLVNDRPTIRFTIVESASGLNPSSLSAIIDGKEITRELVIDRDVATYTPKSPLAEGTHNFRVTASDTAGNLGSRAWSFRIDGSSPVVNPTILVPVGQTAAKNGDQITIEAVVTDDSPIAKVIAEVGAIGSPAQIELVKVPGTAGLYRGTMTASATSTGLESVRIRAEDLAGQVGVADAPIRLDNLAPRTVLEPLADFSTNSVLLEWRDSPNDAVLGGAGVAHSIIEQRIGQGAWQIIRPNQVGNTERIDLPTERTVEVWFRVTQVDGAGNVGLTPSNEVSTTARGPAFISTVLPAVLPTNEDVLLSVRLQRDLPIANSVVLLRISNETGPVAEIALEAFGDLHQLQFQASGLDPGTYFANYRFVEASGAVQDGPVQVVKIQSVDSQTATTEDANATPFSLILTIGALLVLRRLRP